VSLTVLAGDFNYVPTGLDHYCSTAGSCTGAGDLPDEEAFQSLLGRPFGLVEWVQGHFTHSDAGAQSQLYKSFGSAALNYDKTTSSHRPLSFRRLQGSKPESWTSPLPMGPLLQKEAWKERLDLSFMGKISHGPLRGLAVRRLLLLKEAIREITIRMADEQQIDVAHSAEDQVGWGMTFIRAAEKVQDRESVAQELLALQQETRTADDQVRGRRKGQILTRLKGLMPGGATAINAVCKPNGVITTDPAEMADILRTHWKGVSSKK
ncbi:unnamed protein product, partial [Prorocentrum cordatum]